MDFISSEDFLTPIYQHLAAHMKKHGWSGDVGITEIAYDLLVAHDRTADTGPEPETPRFVIAYFDPFSHVPKKPMEVTLLPSGIAVWQSRTHNLRDVLAVTEHQMTHSGHSPRRTKRFFGSLEDLEVYKGE